MSATMQPATQTPIQQRLSYGQALALSRRVESRGYQASVLRLLDAGSAIVDVNTRTRPIRRLCTVRTTAEAADLLAILPAPPPLPRPGGGAGQRIGRRPGDDGGTRDR